MLQLCASSLDDTRSIAAALAALSRRGDLIVLAGEMGAGKTAFAKGFGATLGVAEPITSPTFTLVHSYDGPGKLQLHHADIYRLNTQHEVADLALGELLDSGIVLLEWGDVVANSLGEHLLVLLEHDLDAPTGEDARRITITATGRTWAVRWDRILTSTAAFAC